MYKGIVLVFLVSILAWPASAATYQVTGSSFTECVLYDRHNRDKTTPCRMTKREATARPFDGYFVVDESITGPLVNRTLRLSPGYSPTGSNEPWSSVVVNIPWINHRWHGPDEIDSALLITISLDAVGAVTNWIFVLVWPHPTNPGGDIRDIVVGSYLPTPTAYRSSFYRYLYGALPSVQRVDAPRGLPPAPVPLPATALLLMGALTGLSALRRRSA